MAAANLTANGINSATISVIKSGDGSGLVTDGTGGISCGDLCGGSYSVGTSMTLTASPDLGSRVSGWSVPGCSNHLSCTFTVNADTQVTVSFTASGSQVAPTLSQINPTSQSAGNSITITGTDLASATDVSIAGVSAQIVDVSDTSLVVRIPCGGLS